MFIELNDVKSSSIFSVNINHIALYFPDKKGTVVVLSLAQAENEGEILGIHTVSENYNEIKEKLKPYQI